MGKFSFRFVGRCIKKIFSAAVLAAFLLAVEFGFLFCANFFGLGKAFRVQPGVYEITTENYGEYIMLVPTTHHVKVMPGEKQTDVMLSTEPNMSNYPLLGIVPAATHRALFDLDESESLRHDTDYKPNALSRTVQKYVIGELYVRYTVTFLYEGEEQLVEKELYVNNAQDLKNEYFVTDFPEGAMRSKENQYVSNMKGDTYTQTVYWPEVDYWYITILEVSGVAEVGEAE